MSTDTRLQLILLTLWQIDSPEALAVRRAIVNARPIPVRGTNATA